MTVLNTIVADTLKNFKNDVHNITSLGRAKVLSQDQNW
jgi:hypothetical protein